MSIRTRLSRLLDRDGQVIPDSTTSLSHLIKIYYPVAWQDVPLDLPYEIQISRLWNPNELS